MTAYQEAREYVRSIQPRIQHVRDACNAAREQPAPTLDAKFAACDALARDVFAMGGDTNAAQGAWCLMLCAQGVTIHAVGGYVGLDTYRSRDVAAWRESAAVKRAVADVVGVE